MSKYHNQTVTVDGITFASIKEYRRYRELCLMERAGEIDNLERQVKFELIPTQKKNGCERSWSGPARMLPILFTTKTENRWLKMQKESVQKSIKSSAR